jgi:uncharacterized protein YlxW (UPF0749 family)
MIAAQRGRGVEYTSGTSSWGGAMRRLGNGLRPHRIKLSTWSVLVPVVALIAGLLFTTSAHTAGGIDLRDDRTPQLTTLIDDRTRQIDLAEQQASRLRKSNLAQTDELAGSDSGVAAQQDRANGSLGSAGLVAVRGPGLTVSLDDAPRRSDGSLPAGAGPDDVVVHQQDVQAVVNALWAGGGEAMTIMGVRVISTGAVRCVGNTLILYGRVYSPPFVITAIGNPDAMRVALDASRDVSIYRQDAAAWGLGYQVRTEGDVTLPPYDGSTALQYAQVPK